MAEQTMETVQIAEYPDVSDMVKKIRETHGVYVADGDHRQLVALPIEEFERLERRQKRLLLREEYLRMLINEGRTTEQLQALLPELDMVDEYWLADSEGERDKLFQFTENRFRIYCAEQGVDYEALNDESFGDVVDNLISVVRKEPNAAPHRQ
ncbi:MAG TPA: hypothetical protein P5121_35515 [Caldilineaceae bacterium]|nr:hypothetical protein [Caldilineaceae bacterium]